MATRKCAQREELIATALERRLNFQARYQRVVDFIHAARLDNVLQVRTHSQPVGDVETVVEFDVVLSLTNRRVQRIVVVAHAPGVVEQLRVLLHIIVDMQASDANADVIFGRASNGPLYTSINDW